MKFLQKKNMVAMAVVGALAVPFAAQADEDAEVSGFIDVIGGTNSNPVFVADGEIDVSKKVGDVTVRIDADLSLAGNGGASMGSDSGRIEQAFFAWGASDTVTVLGGVFNNPIGQELEDAPDMDFTSHSVVWNILDNQTGLNGNNIAGVAGAAAVGPATVTVAVLDDIGFAANSAGDKGKTSVALVASLAPMEGLDVEFGFVTQDDQKVLGVATTAGNVINLNGAFNAGQFTVGLDFLSAANIVNNAINLWARFDVNDKANVKVRYETVSFEAAGWDNSTKTTVYGTYSINDNLSTALEFSTGSNKTGEGLTGIVDDSVTTLEFIGTF